MITEDQIVAIREFFSEEIPDDDFFMRHTNVYFSDIYHQITIVIDNINEQDYAWLKEY
jgi:hypothetical protein